MTRSPDDEQIRAIVQNVVSEDSETRKKAGRDLRELGGLAMEAILQAAKEPGEFRKLFIMDGNCLIQAAADARAVEPLVAALGDEDKKIREFAACALAATKDPRVFDPLATALADETIRWTVAVALGRLGDLRAFDLLMGVLHDDNPNVRSSAASALGRLGDVRAMEALAKIAENDESEYVRQTAAKALTKLGEITGAQ